MSSCFEVAPVDRATVCDAPGALTLVWFRVAPQTVSASGSQHYPVG